MTDAAISADGQLRSIVERVERLEEDKKAISEDIKEVYGEAKANGFDVKALRALVAERRKDPQQLDLFDATLDLYRAAIAGIHPQMHEAA